MRNIFHIPQIVPLEYGGEIVLTTRQLAEIFDCTRCVIGSIFKRNKKHFTEGEDYFLATGDDLQRFKTSFFEKFSGVKTNPPFSNHTTNLKLWTKSGALKIARFIGTDNVKIIYTNSVLGHFARYSKQIETPPVENIELPDGDKFATVDRLLKIAEIAENSLRDKILKYAAKLLTGKDF